jgi:hypothetical protein
MKNILIYTGPNKKFSNEDLTLAKIQIDNSLDLGWNPDDIILATDFPFEYKGIKSLELPDGLYYPNDLNANKLPVILYLTSHNYLSHNQLYWCHDFDAYELNKINENEIGLENYDLGLVPYFYKPEWQFGSFFFKNTARDILELIDKESRLKPHQSRNNEKTLTKLINKDLIDPKRYKQLNVTYSIMKRCLVTVYNEAEKPIKILHFRPSDPKSASMTDTALNMFMYGKNRLNIPLMNSRLIKIFNQHNIK